MSIVVLTTTESGANSLIDINNNFADLVSSNATNLALKANLASPVFTGTPILPTGTVAITQTAGDNSTKIATTAYADSVVIAPTTKNGIATRAHDAVSGVQNIAHGLGRVPKFLRIDAVINIGTNSYPMSMGAYNGTTNSSLWKTGTGGSTVSGSDTTYGIMLDQAGDGTTGVQKAIVTWDITNVILTWTKVGSLASGTDHILWQVY